MVVLKYLHKVHRFPLHKFGYKEFERLQEKYYWDKNTTELILGAGIKYIQEKLDGDPRYVIFEDGMQIFYQNMSRRRIIPYTDLTHWNYAFAIWNTFEDYWLSINQMEDYINKQEFFGFTPVMKITSSPISIQEIVDLLATPSSFNPNHKMEGIVVTNQTIRLQGKAVNAIYDDTAENEQLLKLDRGRNRLRE